MSFSSFVIKNKLFHSKKKSFMFSYHTNLETDLKKKMIYHIIFLCGIKVGKVIAYVRYFTRFHSVTISLRVRGHNVFEELLYWSFSNILVGNRRFHTCSKYYLNKQ